MNKKAIGVTSLLLIGVLFGLSGVIAKYLSLYLNPYQVVVLRYSVAFVIAIILVGIKREPLKLRGVKKSTLFWFAITFPASVIFFTLSIFNTTVSLAVFSFYIATLVSSFAVGRIYFNEAITRNKQISLVFILLAVLAFTNPFEDFSIELGFIYGLISGGIQTIASSFQKIVSKKASRLGLLTFQTIAGSLLAGLILVFQNQPLFISLEPFPLVVGIVFGAIFLAISYLFLVGFSYINLNVRSILVSSELLFGPLFALVLLSEVPTSLELVGGVFTIVAVIFANKD